MSHFSVCGYVFCVCVPTLLPCPVEDLDVFQLYTNAGPELHSICSVVFAASFNGAICVSPKQQTTNC